MVPGNPQMSSSGVADGVICEPHFGKHFLNAQSYRNESLDGRASELNNFGD